MAETMEVEVEAAAEREATNSVICQLADPEGNSLGAALYLPENAGPKELNQVVNKLLSNVSKMNLNVSSFLFEFKLFRLKLLPRKYKKTFI